MVTRIPLHLRLSRGLTTSAARLDGSSPRRPPPRRYGLKRPDDSGERSERSEPSDRASERIYTRPPQKGFGLRDARTPPTPPTEGTEGTAAPEVTASERKGRNGLSFVLKEPHDGPSRRERLALARRREWESLGDPGVAEVNGVNGAEAEASAASAASEAAGSGDKARRRNPTERTTERSAWYTLLGSGSGREGEGERESEHRYIPPRVYPALPRGSQSGVPQKIFRLEGERTEGERTTMKPARPDASRQFALPAPLAESGSATAPAVRPLLRYRKPAPREPRPKWREREPREPLPLLLTHEIPIRPRPRGAPPVTFPPASYVAGVLDKVEERAAADPEPLPKLELEPPAPRGVELSDAELEKLLDSMGFGAPDAAALDAREMPPRSWRDYNPAQLPPMGARNVHITGVDHEAVFEALFGGGRNYPTVKRDGFIMRIVHERSVTRGGGHQFPPPFPKRAASGASGASAGASSESAQSQSAESARSARAAPTPLEVADTRAEHRDDWMEVVTGRDFDGLVHQLSDASAAPTAKVRFLILSGKSVSKVAVERRACKTRFKAALDHVLNRTDGAAATVSPEHVYFVSLKPAIYGVEWDELCAEIELSIKQLNDVLHKLRNAPPRPKTKSFKR